MRHQLVLLLPFFLAACSSTPQKPAETAPITKTAPAPAEPKQVAKADGPKVKCSVPGDVRTLEVRPSGKGCELAYVKGGNEGIVATSANGSEHCEKVKTKIQERLAGAGFTCAAN